MPRVLIIAPNTDMRQSLHFALESEGYSVTSRASIAEAAALPAGFDCTVLDHHAELVDRDGATAFCARVQPVILLANELPHRLSDAVFRTVMKPMLGPPLSVAVRQAIDSRAFPK
jgi:CheY-like chemotaxis protein